MCTKPSRIQRDYSGGPGGAQTLRNISWLLVGNDLKSNEVDFKVDAGPDRESMEITNHHRDAGVHVGFGYRMYIIQRGLSHNESQREFCTLCSFLT